MIENQRVLNFTLSARREGNAGENVIRSLMQQLFQIFKYKHGIDVPPKRVKGLPALNYYLFGVIGPGIDELEVYRRKLTEKLNMNSIFKLLLEEGLKNNNLQELFKEITNQWDESNKSINENSIVVIKRMNCKEVTIEVKTPLEEDIRPLKAKLQASIAKLTSKLPFQKSAISAPQCTVRDFFVQMSKTLKDQYQIQVPKKLESLADLNYYLFGVGFDRDLEDFHISLIQKLNKKRIFSLFLEEGLKNMILQHNFEKIKSNWEKQGKVINDDSIIIVQKLNKDEVTIGVNALNSEDTGPFEREMKLEQTSEDINNPENDFGGTLSAVKIEVETDESTIENMPRRNKLLTQTCPVQQPDKHMAFALKVISPDNLKELNFSEGFGGDGTRLLSHDDSFVNLETIDLSKIEVGDVVAKSLSKNESWKNLKTLNLSMNVIGDDGAAALSKNESWINLKTLNLSMNTIADEGASALSKNKSWTNLKILDLSYNKISDEGATALSNNKSWSKLKSLNLSMNAIRDEGANALSKNESWMTFKTLNLSYNKIGDKGAGGLSNNKAWKNLMTLNLSMNNIGDEGTRELSNNTSWTNLTVLNLSMNAIGDEGARELSNSKAWPNLTIINLAYNKIGDKGAAALSNNKLWTNLTTLNLSVNRVGNDGAASLSKNKSWKNLKTLDLDWNHIEGEWVRALKLRWPILVI